MIEQARRGAGTIWRGQLQLVRELFHVTKTMHRSAILREGLKPSDPARRHWWSIESLHGQPRGVYGFLSRQMAIDWSGCRNGPLGTENVFDMWRVPVPGHLDVRYDPLVTGAAVVLADSPMRAELALKDEPCLQYRKHEADDFRFGTPAHELWKRLKQEADLPVCGGYGELDIGELVLPCSGVPAAEMPF